MRLRISCTSTGAASGVGNSAPSRVGITLGQRGIVSVNVIAEVNLAVRVGERRSVNDEHRNALQRRKGDIRQLRNSPGDLNLDYLLSQLTGHKNLQT
jgi:hypothetical protein